MADDVTSDVTCGGTARWPLGGDVVTLRGVADSGILAVSPAGRFLTGWLDDPGRRLELVAVPYDRRVPTAVSALLSAMRATFAPLCRWEALALDVFAAPSPLVDVIGGHSTHRFPAARLATPTDLGEFVERAEALVVASASASAATYSATIANLEWLVDCAVQARRFGCGVDEWVSARLGVGDVAPATIAGIVN